jgi:CopG family nickel-responsive transcriptional regulator
MQRITITVDDDLLEQFDGFMQRRGYHNRSEAFRDLVRGRLKADSLETRSDGDCIGCFSYVYNHHERQLARRLVEAQHEHHDLNMSTLHIHLDHDNCMEAVILRGRADNVRRFADEIGSQGGVRHGNLHIVPVETETAPHSHGEGDHDHGHGHDHGHVHSRPRT